MPNGKNIYFIFFWMIFLKKQHSDGNSIASHCIRKFKLAPYNSNYVNILVFVCIVYTTS